MTEPPPDPAATGEHVRADACPNCGAVPHGRYCHECGQDNRHRELRVRDAVTDAFEAVFSLDSRLVRTIIGLTLRPGALVRCYVDGQRTRHLGPFRYALATCAVWWLCVAMQLPDLDAPHIPAAARISLRYGQLLNLLFVPVLALAQRVAFAGAGRSYAAHLSILFNLCGHVFLWRAGLALLGSWLPRSTPLLNGADGVLFVLYISWALAVCFWPPVPGVRAFSVLMLRIVLTQIAIAFLSAYGLRFLVRWLSG